MLKNVYNNRISIIAPCASDPLRTYGILHIIIYLSNIYSWFKKRGKGDMAVSQVPWEVMYSIS